MVSLLRLVRVERITKPVKAHRNKNGVLITGHMRGTDRMKAWYWGPRGYVVKIIRYKRKLKRNQ